MVKLRGIIDKIVFKTEIAVETEKKESASYNTVPLTLELRKRKYEEEQLKKYGLHKKKKVEVL